MFLSSWPATFSIVDDLLPSCLLPLHVSRLSTPRLQFLFVFHLDESRPLFRRGIRVRRCACRARVRVRQPPSVLAVWPPWEKSTNSAVRSVTPSAHVASIVLFRHLHECGFPCDHALQWCLSRLQRPRGLSSPTPRLHVMGRCCGCVFLQRYGLLRPPLL